MTRVKFGIFVVSLMSFSSQVWGAEQSFQIEKRQHISSSLSDTSLSLKDVLHHVFEGNISLKIKRLQEKNFQFDRALIQEQLDPHATIKSTLSDETTPTTNPFAPSGTTIGIITGNISQPLMNGSTLTLSSSYSRSKTSYPNSVPKDFQSTLNPTYQHQIDLIYRYPIFRGHGNLSYFAKLQQINANEHASHWQVLMEKEQLAAQAVQLFFQMSVNQIAIELSRDAVVRAKKLLHYQKKREHLGLIEKADRLQTNSLLLGRELELSNAQAIWNNNQSSLNRLMHRHYQQVIQLHTIPIKLHHPEPIPILLAKAQKHRAIFMMFDAQKEASHALLTQARENSLQQLDVIGQVGTRALSGTARTAFGQGFTLQDRYLGIGLEWSHSLAKQTMEPAIQKAELALESLELQREQTLDNITTDISQASIQYENAYMTQASAVQRVQMEQQKFKAEIQRYREGRSNTVTVIQFEGELRAAELQSSLQTIQMQWALYRIQLSTGTLLQQL